MRGHKFQSQNLGTECRNFRDCFWTVWIEFLELFSDSPGLIFEIVFGQSGLNFWDCFWIVQAEFLGLFLDSSDSILELFSGNPGLC